MCQSRIMLSAALFAAGLVSAGPAQAQFGTRTLGSYVSDAMGKQANAVEENNRAQPARPAAAPMRRHEGGEARQAYSRPLPSGDALAGTDAETCSLQNGSSLRVSGGFRPSRETTCAR